MNAAVKALGIGPVVGTRTWGGVIGIDSRYRLVDGTLVTQPKYAFWLEGYGWGVENHGVDPDVEVVQAPQDHAAGRDVQLDEAVRMALAALEEHPAKTPPELPGCESLRPAPAARYAARMVPTAVGGPRLSARSAGLAVGGGRADTMPSS